MNTNLKNFSDKYYQSAVAATAGTKIFPKTVIAAAALESGYGKSGLTKEANNFFGVKAYKDWKGEKVLKRTREQKKNGQSYYIDAYFKKYPSAAEGFKDYVKLLTNKHFTASGVSNAKNEVEQFKAIRAGGYATALDYVQKLTSVFKQLKPGQADLIIQV